jgi:hypothetical protein
VDCTLNILAHAVNNNLIREHHDVWIHNGINVLGYYPLYSTSYVTTDVFDGHFILMT